MEDTKKLTKKIKRAVTDSDEQANIYFDLQEKPGVSNLLSLLSATSGKSIEDLVPQYTDKMYGHLKADVAESVVTLLTPIQNEYVRIREDLPYLHEVLYKGSAKAREKATDTLAKVYKVLGFIPKA